MILTHRPTGSAPRRRSGARKARTGAALGRLRIELALAIRRPIDRDDGGPFVPGALWRSRCRGGRIVVNPEHEDFPALLAEALDVLSALDDDPRAASEALGCSATQLVKLIREEPRALALVNRRRRQAGRHPLH